MSDSLPLPPPPDSPSPRDSRIEMFRTALGSHARKRLSDADDTHVLSRKADFDSTDHFASFDTLGPRFPGVDLSRVREAHAVLRGIDDAFASPTIPWAAMAWILVELLRLYESRLRPETFAEWARAVFADPAQEKLVPQLLYAMLAHTTDLTDLCAHLRLEDKDSVDSTSTGLQWCETACRDLQTVHGLNVLPQILQNLSRALLADQFRAMMRAALVATESDVQNVMLGSSYAGILSVAVAQIERVISPSEEPSSYWLVLGSEHADALRQGSELQPQLVRDRGLGVGAEPRLLGTFGPIARMGKPPIRIHCIEEPILSPRIALLGVNHADHARASVVGSVGQYLHAPERPDGAVVYERAVSFRVHPDRLVRLGLPALPSPLG